METVKKSPTKGKAKGSKTKRCSPGPTEGLKGLAVFSALTAFFQLNYLCFQDYSKAWVELKYFCFDLSKRER